MTRLIAHEHAQVPPSVAESYIERYLETLSENGTIRLRLRVPSGEFGIGGGIAFEKDVIAKLNHRIDETHRNRMLTIAWEPEGHGPFPTFSGTLEAISDDYGEGSIFVLRGTYEVPGGIPGLIFDSTVGFWIARATARDLLQQLRDGVERLHDRTVKSAQP